MQSRKEGIIMYYNIAAHSPSLSTHTYIYTYHEFRTQACSPMGPFQSNFIISSSFSFFQFIIYKEKKKPKFHNASNVLKINVEMCNIYVIVKE